MFCSLFLFCRFADIVVSREYANRFEHAKHKGLMYVHPTIFEYVLLPIIKKLHTCINTNEFIVHLDVLPKAANISKKKLEELCAIVTKFFGAHNKKNFPLPHSKLKCDVNVLLCSFTQEMAYTLTREFVKEVNQVISYSDKRALRAVVSRMPTTKLIEL